MTNPILSHVTMTGVDDATPIDWLISTSAEFPLVEWGILYSPKRAGHGGRYPAVDTIRKLLTTLPSSAQIALHVCGEGVFQLFSGDGDITALVNMLDKRGGRVQLNIRRQAYISMSHMLVSPIAALIVAYPNLTFITQYTKESIGVCRELSQHTRDNYALLFDESGGRGIVPTTWPAGLPGVQCGYAGGLGPDNIAEEHVKIRAVASEVYWLDMETKIRNPDSDLLDLDAVERCLRSL